MNQRPPPAEQNDSGQQIPSWREVFLYFLWFREHGRRVAAILLRLLAFAFALLLSKYAPPELLPNRSSSRRESLARRVMLKRNGRLAKRDDQISLFDFVAP